MINFIKNYHILREKIFFNKEDIINIWINDKELSILISEWIIRELRNDLYTLSNNEVDLSSTSVKFILPQFLNKNHYITWEAALNYYEMLYGSVWYIVINWEEYNNIKLNKTSIKIIKQSIEKPDVKKIPIKIYNKWIWDYLTTFYVKIASPEQAIVDYFYDFWKETSRFTEVHEFVKTQFEEKINIDKLREIAELTNDNNTINTIEKLIKWINL